MNFNVVLVTPQIPNNTGNIGRLCVGTHSNLHLVKPLGFEITDSRVKRAGLDYWDKLNLTYHDNFDALLATVPDQSRMFFLSARSKASIYDVKLQEGDWLVFGKEAEGLPEEIKNQFPEQQVTIPFPGEIRSFNLGNAVAMILSEGLRQLT
ncbi:tRNA (cytidine(34)-2'-O)-methyltransferase [Flavobacteriaceae bacterium]|nr:tRNA (cytidine(34)-2'-O)-methyltransferase [Flavobacteriaceae bacterium]